MARKTKNGLDYFPFDTVFFDDDKIQFVSARFGNKGEIIAIKLLCKIYSENGYFYKWGEDESLLFAKRVGYENTLVNDVVNELVKRDFFHEDIFNRFKVLTSKGIQERFLEATERRKKVYLIEEYVINDNINSLNVYINPLNVYKSTQSKVKESRVKESKGEERKENEVFFDEKYQFSYSFKDGLKIAGTETDRINGGLSVFAIKKHCEAIGVEYGGEYGE